MTLRVASVQMEHAPGDKAANLEKIHRLLVRAKEGGAEVVVFPEMCITGYWHVRRLSLPELECLSERVPDGPSTVQLVRWARQYEITIGAGLVEVADDGALYNTYVVAMADGTFARHRKIHAFEHEAISCGNEFTVFDTPHGWRFGVLICYDNNIVENARITALMGAEVLIAPHQTGGCGSRSPRAMGLIDPALWRNRETCRAQLEAEFSGPKGRGWLMRWLPSRAHDNGMFLIFSNGVGEDDGEVRTGNAMIIDCYGEIMAESKAIADDVVLADLDRSIQQTCTGRRWISVRRPDLYSALTETTGNERTTREVRMGTGKT